MDRILRSVLFSCGQEGSASDLPKQGTHAGQAQVLLLTANVVSDSAPPLLYDPQSLLRTSAVLYRHIPRFTALSQTFPPTSEHHRHAVVPLKKIVAMGSSATVFSLHHSDLLVKVFGPEEGSGSRSHSGYWESAFHIEAEAYEAHLSAPALEDAVPRYHGSFLEPDHHTALIVLEDVGDPVCEGEDFGALAVSDRCAATCASLCPIQALADCFAQIHHTWPAPSTRPERHHDAGFGASERLQV